MGTVEPTAQQGPEIKAEPEAPCAQKDAAAPDAEDAPRDKPADPIEISGSLAAIDLLLLGAFLGDW